MPIVIDEEAGVQVTGSGGLSIPGPVPASMREETDRLYKEAAAGIKKDFPGIEFGIPMRRGAAAAGGEAAAAPAVSDEPDFLLGPTEEAPPEPEAPAPPKEPPIGWFNAMTRGLAERTANMVGFIPDTANTIADLLPDWMDQGLVVDQDGIRLASGKEYTDVSVAKSASEGLGNANFGSNRGTLATPEEIKAQWASGDKMSATGNAVQFGIEQGLLSLPDMIAIMANAPLYYIGLSSDYAQQRAQNDGRDKANAADALIAATTGAVVAKLEKIGAEKVFDKLGAATKGKVRDWLEKIVTEGITEAVQNPVEYVGTRLATEKAGEVTAGAVGEQALFGALGGLGGGAAIGGATTLLSPSREQPAPPAPGVRTPVTTPPAGGAPVAGAAPPPAGPGGPGGPAQPAAPAASQMPKPGDAVIFKPLPNQDGVVVEVQQVDPKTQTAMVARVDPESGEAIMDEDGKPVTFIATFGDLGLNAPAAAPVAAAQPAVPVKPSAVPPAATSVEPTSDVAGQLKDMWRADTGRRGVYISAPTVAKMKQEGTFDALKKSGQIEENFDGQGGTLIVKSKKDLDEARAARDGGQTDMQAIVGSLTGAGVAKPNVPAPAVVQRKDETGAVVQQTAVPPGAAAATAAAVATQPGTVEVVTPEVALAERAAKVEAEQAAPPTLEPVAPTTEVPVESPKPKARTALAQLDDALSFAIRAMNTTKGANSVKVDVREAAVAVGTLAQALRPAIAEAQRRGATDEDVAQAAEAAALAERLTEKQEGDFKKGRGVSEPKLRVHLARLSDAVASLEQWADKPLVGETPPAKQTKAEKAKTVSKKKEAKIQEPAKEPTKEDRRTAEGAALRARIEAMSPEEREAAIMRHDLTGLPNRRALDTAPVSPAYAEVDADSLKWVNDNMGEEAGNQLLKNVAKALSNQDGVTAYHVSGDEFYITGESEAVIEAALKAAARELVSLPVKSGETLVTPQITWGTGTTREAASAKMKEQKVAREAKGKRAGRGKTPGSYKNTKQAELPLSQGTTVKVSKTKTKYVPPKKREPTSDQVADQVAEQTAAPQLETVSLAPSNVAGQEAQFMAELLRADPQELANEAQMDKSGRLTAILRNVISAMNNRGNWTGWFAAVTRSEVLTREQRTQLFTLIREYSEVSDRDIGPVREQILGLVTNLDGKTLPPDAIAAVFEAANVARAYLTIRENMLTEEDVLEIEAETKRTEFDTGSINKTTGQLSTRKNDEIARAKTLDEIGNAVEALPNSIDVLNELIQLEPTALKKALVGLWNAAAQNRWINGVMAKAMQDQATGKPMLSSHALMDGFLNRLSMVQDDTGLRRILTSIRRVMPNVPVEFYDSGTLPIGLEGQVLDPAGGRYFPQGFLQLAVATDENGLPMWDLHTLRTFIHESVHSATIYELERNPNGPLAVKLEALRKEIEVKARKKYGRLIVDPILAYYQNKRRGPKPPGTDKIGRYLYGLTNVHELAAETMSNPGFQAFVNSLDQTPTKSWARQKFSEFMRAVKDLLGIKNPKDGRILNDLVVTTLRTMNAQRGRQNRRETHFRQGVDTLMKYLKLSRLDAENVMRGSAAGFDPGVKGVTVPAPPRGVDPDSAAWLVDTYSEQAYGMGVEGLTKTVNAGRMAPADALPRLKNHEALANLSGPRTADALGWVRQAMRSGFVDKVRDTGLGFVTTDFLVRRSARVFGSSTDSSNPLVNWKNIRDTRRSFSNQLAELAEKTVNSKWMKLTLTESEQVGDVLQETTLWQIDPELGTNQPKLLPHVSKKRWDAKVAELEAKWNELNEPQKELYRSVQRYFKTEYARIRKASIDLAIDLYGVGLTPQQKTLLYALKNADGADRIIGSGLAIDLGDQNDTFRKVVKDLVKVSAIRGPYFPLMRKGDLVVEAAREGVIQTDGGEAVEFSTKEDAQEAADGIRSLAPKNTAKVKAVGDKFVVHYKMRHVSFHTNQTDAFDAIAQLKQKGFAVEGDVFTRKLESVESASLTEGLKELMAKAESVAGTKGPNAAAEQLAVVQNLQSAFTQILAERAASASSQLKRQGVAGFKGKEAHEIFTRRVRASSWHYANLKTSLAQSKALSRLRKFSRSWEEGGLTPGMDAQQTVLARGRVMNEITRRLQVEAGELDSLDKSNVDYYLGQLGFINFLATPSYAFVNSMQNFNVALPVIAGKYGPRGARALMRGMRVVAGPAFAKAMRGLASRPGDVTSYDVYSAIAEAVKEDPRFGRFTQPNGNEPSALQQLVDRGVINATYVQELTSIANNQNLMLTRGLEYLRLLPQGAELWNRISTALAVLDVTNGNVDKAADMVDQVHFQYTQENRPRFFRKIGGTRLPQALTMFKMYSVAMYQLTGSLMADAFTRRGQTLQERQQGAMALAGIIAAHTLSAGIIGGLMIEPLRILRQLWDALGFDDDDEFDDLDTMVQRWAMQVTGSEDAARLLSKGAWNALGFDLSDRMGLDKILMYNPPEGMDEDSLAKFMFQTIGGPIPSMVLQRGSRAYEKAVIQGKPLDAIMEMVTVKLFQDARKAWEILHKGVTTRAGETVVPAEKFGYLDAVGRVAGFRTTEEVKAQDKASTEFRYKKWRQIRGQQLTNRFWNAYDSDDKAATAEAVAAIKEFNRKNPGAPITGDSLRTSKQQKMASARSRVGQGRNPDLNELLAY
jgi:GGDEF domain-containing protein